MSTADFKPNGLGDLSVFQSIFFEEADEHLAVIEAALLRAENAELSAEDLNAIFRAVHSIKGSSGMLGFADITALMHELENLLDLLRQGDRPLTNRDVDVLLRAGDLAKTKIEFRKGLQPEAPDASALEAEIRELSAAKHGVAGVPSLRSFSVQLGPLVGPIEAGELQTVFEGFEQLGKVERGEINNVEGGHVAFSVTLAGSEADLRSVLTLILPAALIDVRRCDAQDAGQGAVEAGAPAPGTELPSKVGTRSSAAVDELFVDPAAWRARNAEHKSAPPGHSEFELFSAPDKRRPVRTAPGASGPEQTAAAPAASDSNTIRVAVRKVDQLINLVGELVIIQAMLAQTASTLDPVLHEKLMNGVAQLDRNTRDLQEAAMSIRMRAMSLVFRRFPRVVRELAGKLGKQVELKTVGEGTELDKALIEKITDPLTHLVRNSLDHGVEAPEARVAAGKPAKGTITLRAFHHGGNIIIEVADDGAGLNREKILAKARERGMAVADTMSDQELWQLIFEAGFSTAAVVTDVSGRGVGLDVVRRNIREMGGRVEIESTPGVGTRISIKLPLTLAILDGMSVRVGKEIFIIPLCYVSESLQPKAGSVSTICGRGQVISVRGEYVPVVSLSEAYGMRGGQQSFEDGILVILEAEGGKAALPVDELVGQQQVVIKSFEVNYRRVPGISGATIMGDGRVAMILDVTHIVGRKNSRLKQAA